MVASLALHAGVVLDVVAIGQSACVVTDDEGILTLNTASLCSFQTILDDTGIGASIEYEGSTAELANSPLIDAAIILDLASTI